MKPEDAKEEIKIEEEKKPVKVDFVPDEGFSWDLDLESVNKGKKKKKKSGFEPIVIKSEPT